MLVGDFLQESALRAPGRIALVGQGQRLTWTEFNDKTNQLANALLDLGLEKGATIALLSDNCPKYAITYFAIARTPYISVHCSTRSVGSELLYVLRKTNAEVFIVGSRFATVAAEVVAKLGRTITVILLDKQGDLDGAIDLDEFMDGQPTSMPDTHIDEADGLAITLTGGTTGFPKAVLVSHKARCASAVAASVQFGLDENDTVLASTPLFHTAGLFVWFGTAVMQGATVVFPAAWDPRDFVQLVETEKITAAFLVPSQLNDLVSHPDFSAKRLKSLRNIGYAGAPMGRAMFERVRSALPHVAFTENYGQSEACPITIRCDYDGESKYGTVGRAASNAEVAIIDLQGNWLPAGEIGDIVTRGDQVFDEYFNDPEETAKAKRLSDGWLLTGDVGFLDEDGYLTLVDRSKDMLVSGAENVYPAEIENALYKHAAVAECAVFGIPHERWGEVPAAHVVLAPGAVVSEQELIDYCVNSIARFKRPRLVRFVDKLPKTAVGKIQKNELRAPYWEGHKRKI
jgi:acyl-CoA synthetase (AMP-forming)/AMP-acid ligase II